MTLSKSRRFARAALLSACLAVAGLAVPSMAQAKTFGCADVDVEKTPAGLYGGYFTKISAAGYANKSKACKAAYSLINAYYKCRRAKGVKGSCSGRTVKGLKCKETNRKEDEGVPPMWNADVTCSKGAKKIKHHYSQGLTNN